MAGKTYTQKIQFKGSFDGAEVLSNLKKIRQSMSDAGADASLFKGVDKDIAATEKLINDMLAQIQKGFSNPKEVANFEKQLEKLGLSFSKINVGLQDINKAGNFNLNADEVKKYTTELERLTNQQERLKQAAQESVATQLQSAKLNAKERKAIMDEVEANGDLEAAVKKVAQAKEKAAKAKHGTAALDTETGKSFISGVSGVGLDELGVTAKSGHSKKGRNDARERNARGVLTGNIDETKANAAAIESYRKALEETIKTGGTATDAVEAMKKAMDEYGLELGDTSKLLNSFDRDMQEFQATALSSSQRGAISRAQTLGSTNASGEFELSEAGQELVNNAEYQAMRQNIDDIAESQKNLNRATEEGARQVERYVQEQTEGLNHSAQEQEHLEAAARESTDALKEQSETAQAVNDKFEDMKGAVKTFLSIGSAISGVKQIIQQTFNDIKELDKSFAEIAMVTEYSVQQMWQSYDQYAEMANKLGQSTQSVIQASGLFYQQGLDTEESLALTEDTMKLATLAGLDFAEATSQMTAALRGFHMEMDEGARVTDVYSELAAKAAADVQGIAYAMSKTASIASSAGMEFETTSAFLTQMIETTQEAPENIGTAMKTIIARFTELKENVAGTADSEFDDLDYNKVDTALKSVGVSLKDTNGQFRDLDDVFLELSQKWNTLDRNSQRYIATIAAGSRQQSRFIAMMENYDRTMELAGTAYDSAGRASEQFAKYQDTIEYKINQLQNTWEQFRTNFFDSTFFKSIIDGLNEILGRIQEMDGLNLASLGAGILAIGKFIIPSLLTSFQNMSKSFFSIGNNLGTTIVKGIGGAISKIKPIASIKVALDEKSRQQTEAKLQEIKTKYESKNKEIKLKLSSDLDLNQKKAMGRSGGLKEYISAYNLGGATLEQFEQKLRTNASSLGMSETAINKYIAKLRQMAAELKNNDAAMQEEINDLNKQKEALKQSASQSFQQAGQAIGGAMLTGLTMAMAGAKWDEIFKTAGLQLIASAAPMILTPWMSIIGMMVAGTEIGAAQIKAALISTGIGAIVVALGVAASLLAGPIQDLIESHKEEERQMKLNSSAALANANAIKALEKQQESLSQSVSEANQELQEQESALSNLVEGEKRLTELNNKIVLSNEEKEEWISLQNDLAEQFPTLIDYYDKEGNAILKMGDAWDTIIDKQSQYYAEANKKAAQANVALEFSEFELEQTKLNDKIDKYNIIAGNTMQKRMEELYSLSDAEIDEWQDLNVGLTDDSREIDSFRGTMEKLEDIDEDRSGKAYDDRLAVLTAIANSESQYATMAKQLIEEGDNAKMAEFFVDIANASEGVLKELRDDIKDGYNNYLEANEYLADAIPEEASTEELQEAIENLAGSYLSSSETYYTASDNMQNVMSEALYNQLGIDSKTLIEDWKDSTLGSKYYTNDGKLNLDSSSEDYEEQLEQWKADFTTYLETFFDDDTVIKAILEAGEKDAEEIDKYFENIAKKNFNTAQRIQEISSLDISDELKNALLNMEKENIVADNENTLRISELFGIETITGEGGLLEFEDKNFKWLTTYGENFKNELSKVITNMDNSDILKLRENLRILFSELSLSDAEASALFSIDWSTIDFTNQEELKDEIAKVYEEATGEAFDEQRLSYLFENIQEFSEKYGIIDLTLQIPEAQYDKIKEDLNSLSEVSNTIVSAVSESLEQGFIGSDTLTSLQETFGEDLEKYLTIDKDTMLATLNIEEMDEAFYEELASLQLANDKIYQEKMARIEVLKTIQDQVKALGEVANAQNVINALIRDSSLDIEKAKAQFGQNIFSLNINELQDLIEVEEESLEDYKKQNTIVATLGATLAAEFEAEMTEAMSSVEESTEDNTEALKEYEETLHGTAEWLDEQDPFIALTESISILEKELENLQKQLKEVQDPSSARELINTIAQNRINQLENLTAQQRAAESQLIQLKKFYQDEKYSKYFSELPDGTISFDMAEWAEVGGSDEMGDWLMEMAARGNEAQLTLLEINAQMQDIYDEQEEERNERLENYVNLQEKFADILRENAEEEIDIQKEKYDALKEANDDYLSALEDAINKQRELREQEKAYEDLAQKEKKLALLQRDTSGANEKEARQLEEEIQDDRQQLLDDKVDNIIENLRNTYELQEEIRDLEIEQKENALEEKNYMAEAASILRNMTGGSDIIAWMIENDKDWDTYTIEQQEIFVNEWEQLGNDWATYLAQEGSNYNDFLTLSEENVQLYLDNTSSAITDSIDRIKKNEEAAQAEREKKAKEAIETIDSIEDAGVNAANKINAAMEKLKNEENVEKIDLNNVSVPLTGQARDAAFNSIKNAMEYKYGEEFSYEGRAWEDAKEAILTDFMNQYSGNKDIVQDVFDSLRKQHYDIPNQEEALQNGEQIMSEADMMNELAKNSSYNSIAEAREAGLKKRNVDDITDNFSPFYVVQDPKSSKWYTITDNSLMKKLYYYNQHRTTVGEVSQYGERLNIRTFRPGMGHSNGENNAYKFFKKGGLVDYTGPAWVDGTPNQPEAFLNPQDTARIGAAAELLANLPIFNSTSSADNAVSTNIGDTSIEIHINIDNISDDYDVDQMVERIKQDIVDVSKPIGTSVILNK